MSDPIEDTRLFCFGCGTDLGPISPSIEAIVFCKSCVESAEEREDDSDCEFIDDCDDPFACETVVHVIDVETTGLKPEEGERVIEIGAVAVGVRNDGTVIVQQDGERTFVDPQGRPISPSSRGVHHIGPNDLRGAPDLDIALDMVLQPFGLDGVDICVAHNAPFERSFLPILSDQQWIDTEQCAKHLWPDAPDFKEQTLRYWLELDLPRLSAHRALPDAIVCAHLLARMLRERTVDELLELTAKPALLREVKFGKHYGKTWIWVRDNDRSYLGWIAGEIAKAKWKRESGLPVERSMFDDPNLIFTVETHLG